MEVDIKAIRWKDIETGREYRVTNFTTVDDIVVVWYVDRGTGEQHCMSDVMFTLKHEACGSMISEKEEADG